MLSVICTALALGSSKSSDVGDEDELKQMLDDSDVETIIGSDVLPQERNHTASRMRQRAACDDVDDEAKVRPPGSSRARRAMARSFAVLAATAGMLGLLSVFGFLILESARHMRDHWDVYQKGAQKLTDDIKVLFQRIPQSMVRQYQDASADMVKTAQDILYGLLGDFVNNVSSLLLGMLLTLLYTLFWLCSPVPMDSSIDIMFRKYIMFKTLACFGYGICVGLLLASLPINLASVFALTTFAL